MTADLPEIVSSEEQIYQDAINQPLAKKVDKAIGLIRLLGSKAFVCFSGGKDSVVIKDLARRTGITHQAIYSVTTIDPPELIYFIREFHRDVIWNRQPKHLLQYMADNGKGLPTRLARWCCAVYKENTGAGDKIIGVRAYTNFDLVTASPEALVVAMSRNVIDDGMLIPGGCSICEFPGNCNDDCYKGILEYLKKEL